MSVVAGPRDGPICAYPYIGPSCSKTIASDVYWNYYLPTQVGCLTLGCITLMSNLKSFMALGKKLRWNWGSFPLQMGLLVVLEPLFGLLRAFDPLGWGGIMPGGVDAGLFMLKCSVATGLIIGNMIRAMAKVVQTFCHTSNNNAKFFQFTNRAERYVYYSQWGKNVSDLTFFLLISLEPNYTWIYYTGFVITSNIAVGFQLFVVIVLGKLLTDLLKKNLDDVSSSASNVENRLDEIKRLEDMIKGVRGGHISYLLMSWIPGVWWIWTGANFSTNPPMVPRNFFDYFARILHVWVGLMPGALVKMFDQTLAMVYGKPEVEEVLSLWIVDLVQGRRSSTEKVGSATQVANIHGEVAFVQVTVVPKNKTAGSSSEIQDQQQ
eukprot:TRINITY_DN13753_c0_g1_i1.p1 TRINITY_DN13753_c0_g1~~TRINITY_DN13753_c0_g1_i1.p1  ORF type:complete len:378 (-),score=72.26 TRINITY_DN13753_c0_g1_i1:28-1161(-)